ncbi:MAG: bifunctional diaminohydroxyphosphoribosylaminopyrimidine deaminase/5-amino-6-(5-phosphoribosylamino)uracil reductase RibD [Candidatus Micrarchaeota archaeon]|nr:bifunctional diaminohydroxyphosphoribosylaminopyrimidine deaminase/5-amino-6-(5-phosphoribosylamino)uracil reductase RibD [Candidatus Micrarchaeota archaeon]
MDEDARFMSRALKLARRGEGRVSPNPLVGAVLVKQGRVIGEGWHRFFGGAHAEANAIADAKERGNSPAGATLFVTLEPCSHQWLGKKTPPCVPLIIREKIRRVVIAAEDRNPHIRGIERLKFAGIQVKTGVLKGEAERQNEAFFKYASTGKAFVTLKLAQSSNGFIGISGKGRVKISGREFDRHVQHLRNSHDAVLVGANTVLSDNPRLTCRLRGGRNPVRIVLDSQLRVPLSAKVLRNAHRERVIIATSLRAPKERQERLKMKGASILFCGKERASLRALVESLPSLGIYSLLVEGGAQTAKSALKEGLVDRLTVAVSPKRISAKNAVRSPIGAGILKKLEKSKMGRDTVYSGRLNP